MKYAVSAALFVGLVALARESIELVMVTLPWLAIGFFMWRVFAGQTVTNSVTNVTNSGGAGDSPSS